MDRKPINKSDFGGFTCVKCHVAFPNGDVQREHFRSDWHRYNLKRHIAEFPPVSAEAFREKLLTLQAKDDELAMKTHDYCSTCKKTFNKHKTYLDHMQSKKHIDAQRKLDQIHPNNHIIHEYKKAHFNAQCAEELEVEEVDSDEWEGEPIPPTDCLFCGRNSSNMDNNISHMTEKHSFFIPDLEYCVDLEGLLTYLGKKVGCGFECLLCNERSKQFWDVEAVQHHMTDKGHCMMRLEGEMLVDCSDFYDFSSSYPDAELVSADEEIEQNVITEEDYRLVLPSGAVIGHRSLNRFYRQRIHPNRQPVVVMRGQSNRLHPTLLYYRSLGWKDASVTDIKRKERDLTFMRNMRSRKQLSLSTKANKLQPHFRMQVMF